MKDIKEIRNEGEIVLYGRIFHYSKKALSDSLGTMNYTKKMYHHLYRQIDVFLSKFGINPYKRQDIRDYIYDLYFQNPDNIGKKYNRVAYYVVKTLIEMYDYNIVLKRIEMMEDEYNRKRFLKIIKNISINTN